MIYSFSRMETFLSCPYKFKLRYIDKLETLQDFDKADNALILGTAMHHAIEQDSESAINEYLNSYPVVTDDMETEAVKIELLSQKVKDMISSEGLFEFKIDLDWFVGYVDYIDTKNGILLDFKYSNNEKHYLSSPQIHVYRYLLEKYYGLEFKRIGYLFIPKMKDCKGDFESVQIYRNHLADELEKAVPYKSYVTYDENKAKKFLKTIELIESEKDFPKKENRLCWFCEYKEYCQSEGKEDFMILPKNERRTVGMAQHRKLYIYGAAFSGKTTLCDSFPNPLMLNTDGNIKYVTAPFIKIADNVEVDGHIVRKTMGWEVFKAAIAEREKKDNEFKSIVVDLVEDTYELCRLYMYDKLKIKHESDTPFKAWDMIRTEFLSTIKRLMNLDYENIILISHEDTSKDITKRNGDSISTVKPNIQDKIANKLAGMVDIVIRCKVVDGEHILSVKSDETVFGGGRMKLGDIGEIPCDYEELIKVYSIADENAAVKAEKAPTEPERKPRAKKDTEETAVTTKEKDNDSEPEPKEEPVTDKEPVIETVSDEDDVPPAPTVVRGRRRRRTE